MIQSNANEAKEQVQPVVSSTTMQELSKKFADSKIESDIVINRLNEELENKNDSLRDMDQKLRDRDERLQNRQEENDLLKNKIGLLQDKIINKTEEASDNYNKFLQEHHKVDLVKIKLTDFINHHNGIDGQDSLVEMLGDLQ